MLASEQTKENEEEAPPPLTKAEKKKLKMLQKKKDLEDLITRVNIGECQREIDLAKKTYAVAKKKWKEICMKEGRSEYKDWMMEQWCLFEHLMSIKDKTIEKLKEKLEYTDELYLERFYEDIQHRHQLLKSFYKSIADLWREAETEKQRMLNERESNLNKMSDQNSYSEDYMKTVLHIIEMKKREKDIHWSSEFLSKTDEENNRNVNELEMKYTLLKNHMKDLWKEYQAIMQRYVEETEKRIEKNAARKTKVVKDDREIYNQVKKIMDLKNLIEKDREFIKKGEPMSVELKAVREERDALSKVNRIEKNRLTIYSKNKDKTLKDTVASSNEAIKYLTDVLSKAEKIQKLHKICKKLETLQEQTDRYYTKDPAKMGKFWKRVATAEMIKDILKNKKNHLMKSNARLRAKLRYVINNQGIKSVMNDLSRCERKF